MASYTFILGAEFSLYARHFALSMLEDLIGVGSTPCMNFISGTCSFRRVNVAALFCDHLSSLFNFPYKKAYSTGKV